MRGIRLGRTNIHVSGLSFGALPIQRISFTEAERILRRAYEAGVNFYDTARLYSDSEEKIGAALAAVRQDIVIATKSKGCDGESVSQDIEESLKLLKTDYIDVVQTHNPSTVPAPGDGTGRYEALIKAKEQGKIRFVGLTSHSLERAVVAVKSDLYDTVQYPFSLLSTDRELDLADLCKDADVGFIAMKGLAGGLIRNIPAAYAFIRRYANVVPVWGIQKLDELEEFLALENSPPAWDATLQAALEDEIQALGKDFCRGCGYCQPCPAEIPIQLVARMSLYLARSPWQNEVTPEAREKVARAENCTNCGACASRCPYQLDVPALVRKNHMYYTQFVAEKKAQGLI